MPVVINGHARAQEHRRLTLSALTLSARCAEQALLQAPWAGPRTEVDRHASGPDGLGPRTGLGP